MKMSKVKRRIKKKYKDGVIAFFNVFLVGIMWIIASLGIITIGAASSAAYYVLNKKLYKERNLVTPFITCFKQNLVISLPIQFGFILFGAWLGFDVYILKDYGTEFSKILANVVIAVAVITAAVYMYIWPIVQRFEGRRRKLFKLALIATFKHILKTLCLIALVIITYMLACYNIYILIILPGIIIWVKALLINSILNEFAGPEEVEDDMVVPEESLVLRQRVRMKPQELQKDYDYDDEEDEDDFRDRVIKK